MRNIGTEKLRKFKVKRPLKVRPFEKFLFEKNILHSLNTAISEKEILDVSEKNGKNLSEHFVLFAEKT